MNTKVIWLSILAVVISFIGGFLFANALNKSEFEALRNENNRLKNAGTSSPQDESDKTLTDDEIRSKIAEADQNPNNLDFQKDLGIALYRYASMKQEATYLPEAARLLNRAYEKNPTDKDLLTTLGHLYYDIGYYKKDNQSFDKAREFYQKVLKQNPGDVDVRTDYGLTYFLQNPPEYDKAVAEFQKSLQENPKHEKTLQFLVQALLKQGKTQEAENYLAKLKEINPNTPSLSEIQTQIAQ
ncbi:MAG TPA: tetratricopeptide repeat protein [Pyrinomonadaceae bacterium]|jgi:tetratricopeptide (TPR) repeat protein